MKPTAAEIAGEVVALRDLRLRVREFSFFGDSNVDAIEAQVEVLEELLTDSDVYSRFGDSAENVLDSALEAARWLCGEGTEGLSSQWAGLAEPATRRRQLISSDEAVPAKCQHKGPCSDCPWARTALPGWLGGASPDEWLRIAHSDTFVECHTLTGVQCAGLAIYRRNVCKRVEPPLLVLDRDTRKVFATPTEFLAHHERSLGDA